MWSPSNDYPGSQQRNIRCFRKTMDDSEGKYVCLLDRLQDLESHTFESTAHQRKYSDDFRQCASKLKCNIAYWKIWRICCTLLFFTKKIVQKNTVFQTRHHNFCILHFTEMGLRLSESQINCTLSDVQYFVLQPMERRGENLVRQITYLGTKL